MASSLALELLQQNLPRGAVLLDPDQTKPYETDGLTAYRQRPWVVVLPEDVAQVKAVLKVCNECRIPVVTRGAGTGLSGGALPLADGVLLVLTKLNKILEVDLDARVAVVEPGVTNLAITEAVRADGFYYAPDPSSQIACSIGGNIAENSGGVHCLKYGLTLHNVLGLTVQTIDGDELTLGGKRFESPGYDLIPLFIGSEGMLGVVTQAVLRLLPSPEQKNVLLGAFDAVEAASDCVADIIASGIVPAGLEMMDGVAIRAAEDFVQAGYPRDAEAILLCETDGSLAQVTSETRQVKRLMTTHQARDIRVASNPEDCELMWKGRKAAFPAAGRVAPDYYCMDGTIPRRHLSRVLTRIGELSRDYELGVANVFHAGDGNLHPLILYDASVPEQLQKAERMGEEILELCVNVGGTVTGEHGVGVEKLTPMCTQFSSAELNQFFALKEVFDAPGLMNPGKAIPTLAHCAEIGGMHVHGGELPHPELPRF